jgi:hypothetical protein
MTKPITKAQAERERIEANKRAAFAKRVAGLLGHVAERIKPAHLETAFVNAVFANVDLGPAADAFAAAIAAAEPVGRALHPQKAEAVAYAREQAQKVIDRVYKELKAVDFDVDAAAPYPSSLRESRESFKQKRAKYGLFRSLTTKANPGSYKREDEKIVKLSDDGCSRFIENAAADAAIQYDAFICKLVSKVGEIVDAEISGSHIWSYSFLTVTKADGSKQVWKTQQILNHSVLGTPYLQWPTRLLK